VKFEARIFSKAMLGNLVNAIGLQAVRGQVDVADAVVFYKEINDVRKFASKRWLAAAEPEVRKRWRVLRQRHNFLPRKISSLVQFVPVKTGLARSIAMGRNKENERVELALSIPG
jgi:hypothetical protein